MKCAEPGCDRPARKRGLCDRDYARHRAHGTLPGTYNCPVPGCVNQHYHGGPCKSHHAEFASAGKKWCLGPACDEPLKPRSQFCKRGNSRDGLHSWCRPCVRLYQVENRIAINAGQVVYKAKRRAESPGFMHGLTADQYWSMWTDQGGKCAICSKNLDHKGTKAVRPFVDHDHAHCVGAHGCPACVRSLLCNSCNTMLGYAHDDPAILHRWRPTKRRPQELIDAAIAYLEYWHAEMAKRGVRPPLSENLWSDVLSSAARLIAEIS